MVGPVYSVCFRRKMFARKRWYKGVCVLCDIIIQNLQAEMIACEESCGKVNDTGEDTTPI